MKTLIKKVASLLPELEARGKVYLFALGEREDVGKWDVILSSEWSDTDEIIAVKTVADALVGKLLPTELVALAGVVVIPSSERNIVDMPKSLESASPEEAKMIDLTMMGLDIHRMFIFKAQPSQPASETDQSRPDAELTTAST